MKRLFDIVVSSIGILVLLPVFLISAILVKLTSEGPIFYIQKRVGRNFKSFGIIKFRTMVQNADKIGSQLTAGRDPRITSVGRFLRATKLDELPQLINVLRGDMSFVGPRPEVEKYVDAYRSDYDLLLSVRPGITDYASLKYRHESDILGKAENPEETYLKEILPDKINLGKKYIAERSLVLDVYLILCTVLRMPA